MRSALAYQKFGRAQPEWGWSNAYLESRDVEGLAWQPVRSQHRS